MDDQKINLIYAEDNKFTITLMTQRLEKANFSVKVARDGIAAWELLKQETPDILLLDIEMPGKDGLEILKLFRQKNRQTPVVIYSCHLNSERELHAIELGADDCIRKGCSPELLIAKLKNIYFRVTQGEKNPQIYKLSSLSKYNAVASLLTIGDKQIKLLNTEAKLMHLLCVRFQEISSYDYLLDGLWGSARKKKLELLRKYITELKKKIKTDPSLILESNRNMGYIFAKLDYSFDGE